MRIASVAVTLVVMTVTGGSPALACDFTPALSIDAVVAAGPGGTVPFFGRQVTLVGVVEHQVAATSPALIPVTSARVGTTRLRSWGQAESDVDHLPVTPPGETPYLGAIGNTCGPFRGPPLGASIVKALVRDGGEIDRTTLGPSDFTYHFAEGLTDDMRGQLDASFGPEEAYEVGLGTRLRVLAGVWLPHVLTALTVLAAVAFTVRRARHRRVVDVDP